MNQQRFSSKTRSCAHSASTNTHLATICLTWFIMRSSRKSYGNILVHTASSGTKRSTGSGSGIISSSLPNSSYVRMKNRHDSRKEKTYSWFPVPGVARAWRKRRTRWIRNNLISVWCSTEWEAVDGNVRVHVWFYYLTWSISSALVGISSSMRDSNGPDTMLPFPYITPPDPSAVCCKERYDIVIEMICLTALYADANSVIGRSC